MSENVNTISPTPKWFKVVAIIALIWNILGVMNYILTVTMSPEALASMTDKQQAYMESTPIWVISAFALAVWGGFAGTLALVLKKAWAVPLLVVSLAGVFIQVTYSFLMSNYLEAFGTGPSIIFLLVLPIGIYLVWLGRTAKSNGWIN